MEHTLLIWPRLAPPLDVHALRDHVAGDPLIIFPWGLDLDPDPRGAGTWSSRDRIVTAESLFSPEEMFELDGELTRWCQTWFLPLPHRGEGDWKEPEVILSALAPVMRMYWGNILSLTAMLVRLHERHPFRTILMPQGCSFYMDSTMMSDVVEDFADARHIEFRLLPGEAPSWTSLPSVNSEWRTAARACLHRLAPKEHAAGRDTVEAQTLLIDHSFEHPWFMDELRRNPTVRIFSWTSERCAPDPDLAWEAMNLIARLRMATRKTPVLRGIPLRKTWPHRWRRILSGVIFPELVTNMQEERAEKSWTPDAILVSNAYSLSCGLRRLRLPAMAVYYAHHGIYFPQACETIEGGLRHLTGWKLSAETLSARFTEDLFLNYPSSLMLGLKHAGEPPRDFREEYERKREGKRGVIVVAPAFSSPYSLYTFPHDVERMIRDLLPWMLRREDCLFVFKLHPFPDKEHNEGRGSMKRKMDVIERMPESRRVVYRKDFDASVNRFLYARADFLIDGFSSVVWEAIWSGMPVGIYDPFRQPRRYHPRALANDNSAIVYEESVDSLTARLDRWIDCPDQLRAARDAAAKMAKVIHTEETPDWAGVSWHDGGAKLPRLTPG